MKTCLQFFFDNRTTIDKVIVKILKNTNGPKFADPRATVVSPYFKRSMTHIEVINITSSVNQITAVLQCRCLTI